MKYFQEGGRNENYILELSTRQFSKGVMDQRMEKRGDKRVIMPRQSPLLREAQVSEAEVPETGRAGAVGAVTESKTLEKPVRVTCGQLGIRTGDKWEAHVGRYQK